MGHKNFRILVVDDEEQYRLVYKKLLEKQGYQVFTAENSFDALSFLERAAIDLVLVDLVLPEDNGLELLKKIKERFGFSIRVIVVTGYGSVETAVEAMKSGAFGYFIKSHDPQALLLEIKKAEEMIALSKQNLALREELKGNYLLTTDNHRMKETLTLARRAAESNSSILITGESGVGKEVLARYIHQYSKRAAGSFVAVNCSAYTETLLESELFGHEKGAFTGAYKKREGRFQQAHGGTLFLDEICEISPAIQVKLLRVLEERKIKPVGSNKPLNIDFRLISATNKDVHKAVEEGEFREDLLYRINTIHLHIPPLRERKEDLKAFINHFLKTMERETNKKIKDVQPEVMDFLFEYDYPGNVRELKNIVERLVVLSPDGIIRQDFLPDEIKGRKRRKEIVPGFSEDLPLKKAREKFEKEYINYLLIKNNNNVSKTARELKISRRHLINKINRYGLKGNSGKKSSHL